MHRVSTHTALVHLIPSFLLFSGTFIPFIETLRFYFFLLRIVKFLSLTLAIIATIVSKLKLPQRQI